MASFKGVGAYNVVLEHAYLAICGTRASHVPNTRHKFVFISPHVFGIRHALFTRDKTYEIGTTAQVGHYVNTCVPHTDHAIISCGK